MNSKTYHIRVLVILLFVIAGLWTVWVIPDTSAQQGSPFNSPLPTPTSSGQEGGLFGPSEPPPTATPTPPPSKEAQQALQYISKRYDIPLENLLIVNEHERGYSLIKRTFKAFVIVDTTKPFEAHEYSLLVDLATGQIEEDWKAVQQAEDKAYQARYGKLEPALYDRLQAVSDDTLLPVAIWVANDGKQRTVEEVYAELARQFPEAAQAVTSGRKPWEIEDLALSKTIRDTYRELRAEDTIARTQPLVDELQGQGFSIKRYGALPSLITSLSKQTILALESRDDVAMIYLIDDKVSPETASAVPTGRVPVVWQRGIDGSGYRIAILEANTITSSCLNIIATRNGIPFSGNEPEHKTQTANIAACDNNTYRGVAYGASIIDAAFDDTGSGENQQGDLVEALKWAIQSPQNANVVNTSAGFGDNDELRWIDRAFDYWAREEDVVIIKSAGNKGAGSGNITSPGKAWNIITVGGTNHNQNANWSDDTIAVFSSYVNPAGGDREKPEVVAPAQNITTFDRNGNPITESGTSYAAPQVAGLAALLMDRYSTLSIWPTVVKAIIMASAVNNVDGPSNIPTGQELKDGAGSIDAAVADDIAKTVGSSSSACDKPCWWAINTSSSNPSVGGSLYRYFNASHGERIRVAISWFSNADTPGNNYSFDRLDTNYNLYVYSPSWQLVGYTASYDNNYELADFYAPETGQYKIRVYRSSAGDNNEPSNSVGIAWTKQATYLPDIRSGKNGWDSAIYVRNDSPQPKDVTITFFNTDGSFNHSVTYSSLPPNKRWYYNPTNSNWAGTAVVDASEDVSVVVEHAYFVDSTWTAATNYTGILPTGQGGNPAWGQANTTLYAPMVKRNFEGRTSYLYLMNVGSSTANVTINYYHKNGTSAGTQTCTLLPLTRCVRTPSSGSELTAKISSDQPLAGIAFERPQGGSPTQISFHNLVGSPATTLYAPRIKKNRGGQTAGPRILNTSDTQTAHITINYYADGGSNPILVSFELGPLNLANLNDTLGGQSAVPSGFLGAARITSDQPLVANVTDAGAVRKMSSNTFEQDASLNSYAVRACDTCAGDLRSNIRVQNVGSSAATNIVARFYDSAGNFRGDYDIAGASNPLESYRARTVTVLQIPNNLDGSAVITSDQPIVVAVNIVNPDAGKDLSMTYDAPNR